MGLSHFSEMLLRRIMVGGGGKKTQNGPLTGPPFRSAPLLDVSDTGYCLRFCLKDEVHRKQKSWTN